MGLDDVGGRALFCECKWSVLTHRQAKHVLVALQKKAGEVRWKNDDRKEYFALVAKQVERKKDLIAEGYLVFDLQDIAEYSLRYLSGVHGGTAKR